VSEDGDEIWYRWSFPYFESRTCIGPPWAHVTSQFISFHRPLSDDWKAFMAAGFIVVDVEEPRTADHSHRQDRQRAQEQPDSSLFGGIHPAEDASDYITQECRRHDGLRHWVPSFSMTVHRVLEDHVNGTRSRA